MKTELRLFLKGVRFHPCPHMEIRFIPSEQKPLSQIPVSLSLHASRVRKAAWAPPRCRVSPGAWFTGWTVANRTYDSAVPSLRARALPRCSGMARRFLAHGATILTMFEKRRVELQLKLGVSAALHDLRPQAARGSVARPRSALRSRVVWLEERAVKRAYAPYRLRITFP